MKTKPKKQIGIDTLLRKKLPKDLADRYIECLQEGMFAQEARFLPDNIENYEQYKKIIYKEIKDLCEAFECPQKYTLENMGLTLAVFGITLLVTELRLKEK